MTLSARRRGAFALFSLAGLFLVAGCSSEPPPPKKFPVTGKVTYNGQPVTEGVVSFYDNDKGVSAHGNLGGDGTYKLDAPAGKYVVAVSPPPPAPVQNSEAGGKAPPEKEYPNIPKKYRQASTSGEKTEVKDGPVKLDISMQ